jgi:5-methylcytosine-specific restriction enzyme subunit McrC
VNRTDPNARRLAAQLTASGRIEVLELAQGLQLRANSFVGRFTLGALTVTVHPKIADAPFLNLLRYAYTLRNLELHEPVAAAAARWSFQDLLVHQLVAETMEMLARGIHREYTRSFNELASPRGRIVFNRVVGTLAAGRPTLPCIYYPRSEDIVLNQVVLAGLEFAARLAADDELQVRVRSLISLLSSRVRTRRLDTTFLRLAWRQIDRRTAAYRSPLTIISLLVEHYGLSLDSPITGLLLRGFLFDMNRFFQALISRFLHEYLEEYAIQDQHRLRGLFSYDVARNPRGKKAPIQKPDFVIMHNGKIAAMLDAKYRELWETPLPREMLYQVGLYALAQDNARRQAIIVYPTLSSAAVDQAIVIHGPLTGGIRGEVILRPLNLLQLDDLLRDKTRNADLRKHSFAHKLVFGPNDSR